MKLTPVEILQHLGLNIPDDGVEINSDEAFYHASALQLIGKTMSAQNIADGALHSRHAGLNCLGSGLGNPPVTDDTEERAERSRASLRVALRTFYGLTV